jgi:hypothetical protein
VLVALLIGLAVGLAVGLARPTPDAAEAAGTTRVTWRCMASVQASMYVVLHNASDKKVPVTVYSYGATGGAPIGTSLVEVNPRQTASFGPPGVAAAIEARVPPTVFVAAYASGTHDLLACDKR